MSSWLVHVTVVPTGTSSVLGPKAKVLIVTLAGASGPTPAVAKASNNCGTISLITVLHRRGAGDESPHLRRCIADGLIAPLERGRASRLRFSPMTTYAPATI